MTQPRSEIVIPQAKGYYHCISRCVRRAFLCGTDHYSGRSYEHRKSWVQDRLSYVLESFSIELCTYSVMSNHFHLLIYLRPDLAERWSAEEVAQRWLRIFKGKLGRNPSEVSYQAEISRISEDPELVEIYRQRLSSISWFMRCINEHIARKANKEDECTGRFWEGRFKSIRVDHPGGVVACSLYIDLNPVRAGVSSSIEESGFTSGQARLSGNPNGLLLKDPEEFSSQIVSETDYLELLRQEVCSVLGELPRQAGEVISRLGIDASEWQRVGSQIVKRFRRLIACPSGFLHAATLSHKQWFQGKSVATCLLVVANDCAG